MSAPQVSIEDNETAMTIQTGTIDDALAALTPEIASWWTTIELIAYLMGFWLVISGLVRFTYAHRSREGIAGAALRWFAGILLLNLPSLLNMLTLSVFNQQAPTSALQYAPSGGSALSVETRFVVVAATIIGLVGVIRGLVLLAGAAAEPRNTGRAMTHIIGGILAVNVTAVLSMIGQSAGSTVNSVIQRFIS
ncbi:MAG: hypothetical protein ACYDHY_12820 [Acidiferrobacterales bacterium]